MRSSIIKALIPAAAAALAGCMGVFLQPDAALHVDVDRVGTRWETVRFPSGDGTRLTGLWFSASRTPVKGVVVQFHGNGENMTSHFLYVYWLALEGWDVLAFDYRGYGASEGKKSLAGAVADGRAALAFARQKAPGLPLVVIGQSLGAALAVEALDGDGGADVRALVLDSPFSSYRRIAREKLSLSWLTWPVQWPASCLLISDRLSPDRTIGRRRPMPLLVMHAPGDPVVPYGEGRRLFDLAPPPKEFWDVPGQGHAEALSRQGVSFRPRLIAFLDDALKGP